MQPLPHQLEGARFLSDRNYALLADSPRVGKTGTAIMAADDIFASRILVITTASGRPVWVRGFKDWSMFDMPTRAVYGALGKIDGPLRLIVSWSEVAKHADALKAARWDLVILDEAHYAKSIDTKRTQAVYGIFRGASRDMGIVDSAARVWCLTGTPIPNAPNDLYPMMRAICPERLDLGDFPYKAAGMIRFEHDVTKYDDFLHRYCVVRRKAISRWTKIDVVVGGRNEPELKARLDGFWLRRTQKDVGIQPPIYEMLPVHISDKQRHEIEAQIEGAEDILAAAETGETKGLEMALGTLRRVTGTVKAQGVADALEEELENGLDKVVLMAWHKDVMSSLEDRLKKYGIVRVDGSTTPQAREMATKMFQTDPACRVFIGQIVAAGEAIDLSAAAELVFVESSFVPKDMQQAALRITNHGQKRQTRVRVAALEGSVDEALQAIVIRKTATLKEIIQ
jgi:SWI/SNF-related matrix-associated actin-dependent regulator of chromatin subfamily A-like protein 1